MSGPNFFAVIIGPVLDCRQLADSAKILYARVASLADREGYCWASNKYLAEVSGCGERTVSRLLSQLQALGFLKIEMVNDRQKKSVERRIFIGNMGCAGVDKNGVPPRQKWRGGVAKNGEALNNVDKERIYIPPTPQGACADLFERFWSAYPKKRDKPRARKAWEKLAPDLELCRVMSAALAVQKKSEEWTREKGRFVPYPATWLNGRRWEDEMEPVSDSDTEEAEGGYVDGL